MTVIVTGFVALLLIGPAGRALGDGISFVLNTGISRVVGGAVCGTTR